MNELNVASKQLEQPNNPGDIYNSKPALGSDSKSLTGVVVPLYARSKENNMDQTPEVKDEAKKANGDVDTDKQKEQQQQDDEAVLSFENLTKEAKKQIEAEVERNKNDWTKWVESNKNISTDEIKLVTVLKESGVTLNQYLQNKDFYEKNRVFFENKKGLKEIQRLVNIWRKHFEATSKGKEEFQQKAHIINVLAIGAGLTPREFAKKYDWKSYFHTDAPQAPMGILKAMVVNVAKDLAVEIMLPDDPKLTPEQNKFRKRQFAETLWGASNTKQAEDAKNEGKPFVLNSDTRQTQQAAIEMGIPPHPAREQIIDAGVTRRENSGHVALVTDKETGERMLPGKEVVLHNAELNESDRQDNAEKYLKELGLLKDKLSDAQKIAILEAHNIGFGEPGRLGNKAGVFDYTQEQIFAKMRRLKGLFTPEQMRALMEAGYVGSGGRESGRKSEGEGSNRPRKIRNEQERIQDADEIKRAMSQQEFEHYQEIKRRLKYTGVELDLNDPTTVSRLVEIAKKSLAKGEISEDEINEFVHQGRAELPFMQNEEGEVPNREEIISQGERQSRSEQLDSLYRNQLDEIKKLPDEGRKQLNEEMLIAKEQGLTPEQAGLTMPGDKTKLNLARFSKANNFGRYEEDDEYELEPGDLKSGPLSPEAQKFLESNWDKWERIQSAEGVNISDPKIRQQINEAKASGTLPEFANIDIYTDSAPIEQQEMARKYWERLMKSQAKSGKKFTKEEIRDIEGKIRRGELPAISGGAIDNDEDDGYGANVPPHIEKGRRRRGGQAMWERVQNYRSMAKSATEEEQLKIEQEIEQIYEYETPKNVHDFAWQIGQSSPEKYGVQGQFPVLEVRYTKDGSYTENGKTYSYKAGERVIRDEDLYDSSKTEAIVNKSHFVRWVRDRMMYLHGDTPDDPIDFQKEIYITKVYSVNLGTAMNSPDVYFRDEKLTKQKLQYRSDLRQAKTEEERNEIKNKLKALPESDNMEDLLDEIKRETWAFGVTRTYDLNYRARSGGKEEFTKMMAEIFARSPFTKTVWGKSLIDWVFTWDQEFDPNKVGDHKLGAAIAGAYQVYYNLTDTARLRELLGPNSALLSREGLKRTRDDVAKIPESERIKASDTDEEKASKRKNPKLIGYISDSTIDDMFVYTEDEKVKLEQVYAEGDVYPKKFVSAGKDKNGKPLYKEVDSEGREVINEWKFIKNFNIFSNPQFNTRAEAIVHAAIKADIAKKFNLTLDEKYLDDEDKTNNKDGLNVDFAQTFAFTMTRWTGAQARNNQSAAGYDAWVSLQKTKTYRMKYAEGNRGEAFGNPYTIHMINSLNSDLMTGIRTESKINDKDRENNRYANRSSDSYKTPIEVIDEMMEVWHKETDPKKRSEMYESKAAQLLFPANTLKYFAFDHIKRGMDIYDQIIDAAEIKLEKFTRFDPIKGVTFERDQFQSAVQDKFLKPMRYLFSTWKQTDFSQIVSVNKGNEAKTGWKQMTLAEATFGHEVLDIPEFWERFPGAPKKGDPDYDKKYKEYAEKAKAAGAVLVKTRPSEGDPEYTWRFEHKISGMEVNDNRTQLIRQVAKTRIAAELYAHIDWHSNDPRYDFMFYETIIQALERIPGGVWGDDTDLKSAKTKLGDNDRYFSKEDIAWIRKKSNTTRGRLFGIAILMAIINGTFKGIKEGAEKASKHAMEPLLK